MKKSIGRFAFIAGVLVTLFSCEYSPPEIPDAKLDKPSEVIPEININLTPDLDTLKLYTTVKVNYTVDVGDRKIYNIQFFMDGQQMGNVYSSSQNSYYTTVPTYLLNDGLHELKIVTYTSTNSGSIADKLQAEQYFYELKWPVLVNKQARDQMKITSLQPVSDGIKLSWFKYDYADFQRYILSKSSIIPNQGRELVNSSNPYLTSFVDNSYIEGDYVTYSLVTYMDGLVMDSRSYVDEIKRPKVKINSDRTVDVTWSPSQYPKNVESYFLKTSIPQYGYPEDHEISDLSQTAFRFKEKIGFGGNYGMQLRYIPKGFDSYKTFDVKGGFTEFALGDSIPAFQRGFFIHGKNSILIYKDGKFWKYNCETGQSSDALSVTPIESVDQRYIIGSGSGNLFGYFEDRQFVVRNSDDLLLMKRLNLEAYEGFNFTLRNISLSDNGVIATIDYYNTLRIFNIQNGMKIIEKKYDSSIYLQNAVLAPDGTGVCIQLGNYSEETNSWILYNIELNQLNEINRYVKPGSDYESTITFSPVNGKIISFSYLGMHDYKVDILNAQTLAVEKSVRIPSLFVPIAYDYVADQVIAQYKSFPTKKFSYLFDMRTGKQSTIVQFSAREQYLFSNGTVYAGNGRSIKIDDFILE